MRLTLTAPQLQLDRGFYSYARDYVLRLVWTVRRLREENKVLRRRLGESQ